MKEKCLMSNLFKLNYLLKDYESKYYGIKRRNIKKKLNDCRTQSLINN